jgi:hypothetical protein
MGSTDGLDPWQFAAALGYPSGSYAVPGGGAAGAGGAGGSVTDGPRIVIGQPTPAPDTRPLHGWWDAPAAVAAPPPPLAPAPGPGPGPAPPPLDLGVPPAPGPNINPIGPGRPLTPQPTTLGNALGNAVLNPPQRFWVGSQDSYDNARKTSGRGSMQTTQT